MARTDIERFVEALAFAIPPSTVRFETRLEHGAEADWRLVADGLFRLDSQIVRLPERDREMRALLEPLHQTPSMCTFAIAAVINTIVGGLRPEAAYLNVGVWHGYSLIAGMLGNADKRIIGVDDFSAFGGPRDELAARFRRHRSRRHRFVEAHYQDYFARHHKGAIGFYFYDADHAYEHQLAGLQLAEPFLTEDALILVDDTNMEAPRQATLDFMARSRNRYAVIWDVATAYNRHPTAWNGVMLLRRLG